MPPPIREDAEPENGELSRTDLTEESEHAATSEDGEVENPDSDTQQEPTNPPLLPSETTPPLPQEAPPIPKDDGWDPIWDDTAQAYYFYNRFTQLSQWTNPRVPDPQPSAPGVGNYDRIPPPSAAPRTTPPTATPSETPPPRPHGGYDPAIHGDYDPTAPYAQPSPPPSDPSASTLYTATGTFNRFTGKWQPATQTPENHNDENKSKRQMNAFFDVDAAANSHNGKSLKAERAGKKLSKQELKAFKEKRRERKEERRRAWLRD